MTFCLSNITAMEADANLKFCMLVTSIKIFCQSNHYYVPLYSAVTIDLDFDFRIIYFQGQIDKIWL